MSAKAPARGTPADEMESLKGDSTDEEAAEPDAFAQACSYNDGLWAGLSPEELNSGMPTAVKAPSPAESGPAEVPAHTGPTAKEPAPPKAPVAAPVSGPPPPSPRTEAIRRSLRSLQPSTTLAGGQGWARQVFTAEEPGDPEDEFEEIVVDPVPPGFAGASAQAGAPPSTSSQVAHEERDDNGQYIYRPSFTDPPVDESELDEDGFTAQDRADLAALRATYDRIANRWQALSPRSRNRRLLQLAQRGTVPLVGLVHISAATQAVPADGEHPPSGKGRGKRSRFPEGTLIAHRLLQLELIRVIKKTSTPACQPKTPSSATRAGSGPCCAPCVLAKRWCRKSP